MPRRSDPKPFDDMMAAWRREFPAAELDHFLLGAALMRIGQIVAKDLTDQAQSMFRCTAAEIGLLFALRRQGPPYAARPRTLSNTLLITSGAVTKQIDRLEARGLVSRAADPESLNGQLVSLTPAGVAMTGEAVGHLAAHSVVSEVAVLLSEQTVAGGEIFARSLLEGMAARSAGKRRGGKAVAPADRNSDRPAIARSA